jgi:hypothetical protein
MMMEADMQDLAADLFAAPLAPAPARQTHGFAEERRAGYAALLDREPEIERFCAWRGRSGRRYVTSIYSFDACPDYEHVVALAVRRGPDGTRTALAGIDLGVFPMVALDSAAMRAAREQGANEVHLHLLAETAAGRAAAIEDLV